MPPPEPRAAATPPAAPLPSSFSHSQVKLISFYFIIYFGKNNDRMTLQNYHFDDQLTWQRKSDLKFLIFN